MALFTDNLVSEASDLVAYESDLTQLASSEGIDLNTKLMLAQTEVGAQIEGSSRRPGSVFFAKGVGFGSASGDASLPRFDLNQVVVTPPLKLWHTFQTLSLVYRDASSRQVNDKFQVKWREYRELSKWASELLFQTGVGLVTKPIPRAAQPTLSLVSAMQDAMALFVRVSWTRSDGSEGAGSPELPFSSPSGQALQVSVGEAPPEVSGWNLYLGTEMGTVFIQNAVPLGLAESFVVPTLGALEGELIGEGQPPELLRTAPRFLQRG